VEGRAGDFIENRRPAGPVFFLICVSCAEPMEEADKVNRGRFCSDTVEGCRPGSGGRIQAAGRWRFEIKKSLFPANPVEKDPVMGRGT